MREIWEHDRHSHRVILNVGRDWSGRKDKKGTIFSVNILNRPRVFVLMVIVTVLLFLFLKEAKVVLASNPQFMIKEVIVENANLIGSNEIDKVLKLDYSKGLFGVSTKEIVRLLKKDPDIEHVVAEKIMPGTLKIKITERAAYAKLITERNQCFIGNDGIVLLRERTAASVPIILGLDKIELTLGEKCTDKRLENILNLLRMADENELGRFIEITKIDAANEANILMYTSERILVKFKISDMQEMMDKLILILSDAQKKNKIIKTVDLRFKDVYVE